MENNLYEFCEEGVGLGVWLETEERGRTLSINAFWKRKGLDILLIYSDCVG